MKAPETQEPRTTGDHRPVPGFRSAVGSASERGRLGAANVVLRSFVPEAPEAVDLLARDALQRRTLVLADLVGAVLALVTALVVVGGTGMRLASLVTLPIVVALSKIKGLYDRDEVVLHRSTLDEAPALFELATLYTLLFWLLQDPLVDGEVGQAQAVALWSSFFVGVLVTRALARALASRVLPPERCLLIGDASSLARVSEKLRDPARVRAELVGYLPLDEGDDAPLRSFTPGGGTRLLDREVLATLVADGEVHRVYIAPDASASPDDIVSLITRTKALGVKVSIVPRMFEVVGSSVEFDSLDGVTVLGVRRFGLTRSSRAVKRAFDIAGSALGLVGLAPMLLLVALAIRLDSRGPILFRQTRVGRDGRLFDVLKFRSMHDGADAEKAELRHLNEAEGLFKIADDPRVTRVGRLLRRSSLDELPQLVNVLRGEMSLVGPRPLVAEDDRNIQGWHRRRLHLTPGMTGQWQVLGSARIPLREMVSIDYLYVANWSLWLDVKILLRTVAHVLRRDGV